MAGLPTLKIGQHEARYPIIQGGMAVRISAARLASAVANEGGIGTIAAVGLGLNSPYFSYDNKPRQLFVANRLALRDELQKARQLSPNGIIAINSMVAVIDHADLVRTAAENGVQVVISGAGLPMNLPQYVVGYPAVALVPIVSTARAAKLICRRWEKRHGRLPDGFVVENPNKAGGHLGAKMEELGSHKFDLERVVPELVDYLQNEVGEKIPVIAAGGIWDRADIDRMLALGASGVQMATRFICTHECDAADGFKQKHLRAKKEDSIIIESPVGMPGRGIRSEFTDRLENGGELENRCIVNCLHHCRCRDTGEAYCIVRVLDNAQRGYDENSLIFAGSNAYRAEKIVSVKEIMAELTV
jgi:nitronate monooxygenase